MKKFLLSFVAIVIALSAILFSACNKDDNFYENTKKLNTDFFNNSEIAFIFSNDQDLDYSSSISEAINSTNPNFKTLSTIYLKTLKEIMFFYSTFQVNLNLQPKLKTKQIKKNYLDFENNMLTLQQS